MKDVLFRFPILTYSITLLIFILAVNGVKNYIHSNISYAEVKQQNLSLLHTVDINIYTAQGTPSYRLNSEELEYLIDSDDMRFRNVAIERRLPQTDALRMTADQGEFDKLTNRIYLRDNVKMKRRKSAQKNEQTLSTPSVIIELSKDIGHTKERVVLQDGKTRTEGVGMTADLKTSEIKLHSQTKVTYEK